MKQDTEEPCCEGRVLGLEGIVSGAGFEGWDQDIYEVLGGAIEELEESAETCLGLGFL